MATKSTPSASASGRVCDAHPIADNGSAVVEDQHDRERLARLADGRKAIGLGFSLVEIAVAPCASSDLIEVLIVMTAAGLKDEVLDRPTDAYVRTLMESAPEMDPAWLDRLLASRAAA